MPLQMNSIIALMTDTEKDPIEAKYNDNLQSKCIISAMLSNVLRFFSKMSDAIEKIKHE